jgi:hypothetical protein
LAQYFQNTFGKGGGATREALEDGVKIKWVQTAEKGSEKKNNIVKVALFE